jgi:hypothetical protein
MGFIRTNRFFVFFHKRCAAFFSYCKVSNNWFLALSPFESSFPNTNNSNCYENSQNDYTQLIVLFDMFLISIKRFCVMYNSIEEKESKTNYLKLYSNNDLLLFFDKRKLK